VESGPNTILDYEQFFQSLSVDEIEPRLEKVTALGTLHGLLNYIESQRFRSQDEQGTPYTEPDGSPRLEEVRLSGKLAIARSALAQRLGAEDGIETPMHSD
jgi:hypothetical protein